MPRLEDRTVAALKADADRYEVFDSVVPALAVRVGASGTKSWVLFYRRRVEAESGQWVPSRELTRWTLGRYPAISVAEARRRAKAALVGLEDGLDPAHDKQDARQIRTFKDLAEHYVKYHAKLRKKSWDQDERTLNVELLPLWRKRPAKAITRGDVRSVLESVVERGSPVMANRVWSLISKIFNHGLAHDLVEVNPASMIRKQPELSRDRVLTDAEITALWSALTTCAVLRRTDDPPDAKAAAVTPMIALGLQVMLLTGQRPGEVFSMERSELDLEAATWELPAKKVKNKEAHVVPLSDPAKAIIETAIARGPKDGKWVFSGQPIGNVGARAKKAAADLRHAEAVTFEFRRHDLRRTVASGMARSGVAREVISRILNHADRGARATQVYDRYDRLPEKRAALDAWADTLTNLVTPTKTKSAKVVRFRGKR